VSGGWGAPSAALAPPAGADESSTDRTYHDDSTEPTYYDAQSCATRDDRGARDGGGGAADTDAPPRDGGGAAREYVYGGGLGYGAAGDADDGDGGYSGPRSAHHPPHLHAHDDDNAAGGRDLLADTTLESGEHYRLACAAAAVGDHLDALARLRECVSLHPRNTR